MINWILVAGLLIAQAPDFKLVADTSQIMDAMVIPASNVLFNVPVEVPEGDAGWADVENNAVLLAESGNLLLLRAEGREPWIEASHAMIDAGAASLEAARNRDVDGFNEISDRILASCSACHDVYVEY